MPKPTATALAKKPQAVVIQQFRSAEPTVIALRDFEWFEGSGSAREEWYAYSIDWAVQDVTDHGDVFYVFAEVTDTTTTPITLGQVTAQGPDGEWESNAVKAVTDDPQTLLAPATVKPKAAATTQPPANPKPKGKAVVRPRAASAAAAAVKGATPTATPEVKAKAVRAKKPAQPVAPVAAPTGGDKRAAALKKRLAAKQAEGGTKQITAADQVAVDAEVAEMEKHSKEPALVGPST